jgi:YD repeat-containing protein
MCEKCHCQPRCLAPDLSGRWGRGNLTKDKNGYTYHYDHENRLIKIKKSNDTVDVAEFTYDALGRRIEKKDSIANKTDRYYYNDNWSVGARCEYEKK